MIIIDTTKKMDLSLAPATETDAKVQELYILICTIQGECPLYRDFGVANDYLHMPINAAQTAVLRCFFFISKLHLRWRSRKRCGSICRMSN